MKRRMRLRHAKLVAVLLATALLVLASLTLAAAEDEQQQQQGASDSSTGKDTSEDKDDVFDPENEDWGSYYDPQKIFCGRYDCYKILGFDYESFGRNHPDKKEITKRYRKLSRVWHPDKSKKRNAKNKFVMISRAYEVLTNDETREEYDQLRYDQEAYYNKYGTSILRSYAPKSDVVFVVLVILAIANIFSWYSQKHRWQLVADRLIKAAVEDWSPREGGTPESKQLREQALQILRTDAENSAANATNGTESKEKDGSMPAPANTKAPVRKKASFSKGKKEKVSGKERKKMEQEALVPVVTALVNDMDDFGGGFHKPTWNDLFAVSLAKMPYTVTLGTAWQIKYWVRRLQKKELNDEEKEVLTERAVGPVSWDIATDEEREQMIKRELWKMDNLVEWNEEQEVKKLSASEQKYYNKLKKKGKLE